MITQELSESDFKNLRARYIIKDNISGVLRREKRVINSNTTLHIFCEINHHTSL